MQWLLVFLGGGMGSLLRHAIGIFTRRHVESLPAGTLIANIAACVIFALVVKFYGISENNSRLRLLLLTGFCGGLSTFSAFGYETFLLLKSEMITYAILNIVLSVTVCAGLFFAIVK